MAKDFNQLKLNFADIDGLFHICGDKLCFTRCGERVITRSALKNLTQV